MPCNTGARVKGGVSDSRGGWRRCCRSCNWRRRRRSSARRFVNYSVHARAHTCSRAHARARARARIWQVLVNSDSRHVRGGDAVHLVAALGEADSLLLSPATHELRAYNRLAMGLSRGSFVIFVQDDTRPPPPSAGGLLDVRWLTRSVALFLRWPQVSSVDLATRPTNSLPSPHQRLAIFPPSP